MRLISEITITGIVKEYVEGFRGRAERENKNLLFSIFCRLEEPYIERIKELEEKCKRKERALVKLIEQSEKMKCCGNCEHNGSDSEIGENGDYTDYTCIQCDDFSTKENPYPNWELSE